MHNFTNTVSSIYWDIAKDQLDRHFLNLYLDYRSSNITFTSLESIIHVKAPIISGIKSIQRSLGTIGIDLPNNITDIIIHSETPLRDCKEIRGQIRAKHLSEKEKGEILFRAAAAVHKQRIQDDSIGKGFSKIDVFSRYVYLPIELIGFDNALEDYSFIKSTAEILALRPKDYYVAKAYELAKSNFKEKYAIFPPTLKTIQRAILCLPPHVNPKIYRALTQDDKLLRIVARQALQNF